MQDRDQNNQQNPNPGKLAVTDEKQRTQAREEDTKQQQVPTGNERNEKTGTDGTKAGMGE